MQKPASNPVKPRQPRWRELTDEQRWARIYADRKRMRKSAPKTVRQACALSLPAYAIYSAVEEAEAKGVASVREDVKVATLSSVAKVSALLRTEGERDRLATMLEREYQTLKSRGFYIDVREFLYCQSCALVKMVDTLHFPPDAPAVMAALLIKEDAEEWDAGDWGLSKEHAIRQTGIAYEALLDTGMYVALDS